MIKPALTILMLCLIALPGQTQGSERADGDRVRLAVYFQSMGNDSIRFMKEQLYPTWNSIPDIMDVDLNAYGNSSDTPAADGGYSVECENGPAECVGNMILACAKSFIPDQTQYVDFTLCVMMSESPYTAGPACAGSLGIDYKWIRVCSTDIQGEQFLHYIGVKQASLDPPLDQVPWMVINDVHTDEIQQDAEFGLQEAICSAYEGTAPAGCS